MYTHLTTLDLSQYGFSKPFDYLKGFWCREDEEITLYSIGTVWLYGIKKDGTQIRSFRLLKRYIADLINAGIIEAGD